VCLAWGVGLRLLIIVSHLVEFEY